MADVSKVLSSLSTDSLNTIIRHEEIPIAEESPKKAHLVDAIGNHAETIGFNLMSEQLSREELEAANKILKVDLSESGKHPSKPVLRKRLVEKMTELGMNKLFDKLSEDEDLMSSVADTVGLDVKDAKKAGKDITREIGAVGLEAVFNRLDTPFLKSVAEELNLSTNTINKARIVKAIITGKNVKVTSSDTIKKRLEKQAEEAEEALKKKEKRPDIKKGVTYQELFQLYLRQEIFDWAKENGLKVSGSKPDLIKRVLAFLDGDKENTMAQPKAKKEGGEKSPKKSPKKATKKTETKEKSGNKSDSEGESKSKKSTTTTTTSTKKSETKK